MCSCHFRLFSYVFQCFVKLFTYICDKRKLHQVAQTWSIKVNYTSHVCPGGVRRAHPWEEPGLSTNADLKGELEPPAGTDFPPALSRGWQTGAVTSSPHTTTGKHLHYTHQGHDKQTSLKRCALCWFERHLSSCQRLRTGDLFKILDAFGIQLNIDRKVVRRKRSQMGCYRQQARF